jgi:hypothetical protein
VLASGQTEVAVRKGRVRVGEEPVSLIVKEGNVARVDGRATEVVKLDKKQRDSLDAWSKDRADELAEANRKITRRQASTLLASLQFDRFNANYGYRSGAGVWYFDTRRNCYTFVPFIAGWRSPYGGWYDNMVWGHPMPCGGCSGGRNPFVFASGGQYGNPGTTSSSGGYPGGSTAGGSGYPGGGVNTTPTPVVRETRTPVDYGPVTRKMTREVEP